MGGTITLQDVDRLEKSFGIALLEYLFVLKLHHHEIIPGKPWSLSQLQHSLRLRVIHQFGFESFVHTIEYALSSVHLIQNVTESSSQDCLHKLNMLLRPLSQQNQQQ